MTENKRSDLKRVRNLWSYHSSMRLLGQFRGFIRELRNPRPLNTHEPTEEQKQEITEAIRKQRFRGDMAGRLEYQDKDE